MTSPLSAQFRCGHDRTAANMTGGQCRTCKNVRQRRRRASQAVPDALRVYRAERAKRERAVPVRAPKALRWISAPRSVIESCRPAFDAAMAVKKAAGRPKTSPQTTTHSEAA